MAVLYFFVVWLCELKSSFNRPAFRGVKTVPVLANSEIPKDSTREKSFDLILVPGYLHDQTRRSDIDDLAPAPLTGLPLNESRIRPDLD